MRNMFDYFLEHGNDDFKKLPFNEVDAAILCQLSYLNLEILVPRLEDNKEDLDIVIKSLKSMGYKFSSLDELYNDLTI